MVTIDMNLYQINTEVSLVATEDGLLIKATKEALGRLKNGTSLPHVRSFINRLESLSSDGLLVHTNEGWLASIESLEAIERSEHDPLELLFQWSPFSLVVAHEGTLGYDDFRLSSKFYLGKRIVIVHARGAFARRNKSIFRLPISQVHAIRVTNWFNTLPSSEKNLKNGLEALYELQELTKADTGPALDDLLTSERVIKPSKIGIRLDTQGDHATAYPVIDGVSEDSFKREFLSKYSEVQTVYNVETSSGRQRVIIGDDLAKVLKVIKKDAIALSGKRKDRFIRNPRSILPDGVDRDLIDIHDWKAEKVETEIDPKFGPRVKGIGFPEFVRPFIKGNPQDWFEKGKSFGDDSGADETRQTDSKSAELGIECEFIGGKREKILFSSIDELRNFEAEVRAARVTDEATLKWGDFSIPITQQFAESISDLVNSVEPKQKTTNTHEKKRKHLIIYTNEEKIDFSVETQPNAQGAGAFQEIQNLLPTTKLKIHQMTGIGWLQNSFKTGATAGGLLADDMGLGKTLQVLSFLSWCIEEPLKDLLGKNEGPYEPILIVAPLSLLDVWTAEIEKYFNSSIFQPYQELYGETLKKIRRPASRGKELEAGESQLDLQEICKYRLNITNYDTVRNYQFSFAQVPWSVVVVDEAQEIKEPNTSITHALKTLNPYFRIASTGTPVENSLSNFWSIMDFVEPGNVLGSLNDFLKRYERNVDHRKALAEELRSKVRYNQPNGLVRRRTKREVLSKELPKKHMLAETCPLGDEQRAMYLEILNGVGRDKDRQASALVALQRLSLLTQHPFLLRSSTSAATLSEYMEACPKLQKLVEILKRVKQRGEKALIFTRTRAMQDMLKEIVDGYFEIDSRIINGTTKSKHAYVANTRKGIVDTFSAKRGFDLLILSPEVAGVGLTITAASHVIHYGRWWNPAKESQATDRAYRIGQTKEVFVYHLLSIDPKAEFETFDQKLDKLLKAKEALAEDFLAAADVEGECQDELINGIFGARARTEAKDQPRTSVKIELLDPYELEALVSQLFWRSGHKVVLTPKSGDRGVDVIAVKGDEVRLIQVKHRVSGGEVDEEVLTDLQNGLDYYREHLLPRDKIKSKKIVLEVISSGTFLRSVEAKAKQMEIQTIDGRALAALVRKTGVTHVDIILRNEQRCASLKHLRTLLDSLF